ncbi:MAG TPA: hypothetical protein ENI23_03955, partial [bacterium]|nr:hypothetical protein [bacterium]
IFPSDIQSWGYTFGGSSITDKDWEFIAAVLKEEKVKRVLEIGSGFSTLLMMSMGIEVVSFETRQGDIDKLKRINPNVEVYLWDGKDLLSHSTPTSMKKEPFDLVFVDGPAGGENREPSFEAAIQLADKILVHDAGRVPEKKWTEKYLIPKFSKVAQGGHRTAFFKLAEVVKEKVKREKAVLGYSRERMPYIKVVFNGRGEGGAERSTTWIMNTFQQMGWAVDYISPNPNPSGTFRKEGRVDYIPFTNNLSEIKEPCDILFLYCNDWIWEFKNLNEVFSNLQAKRKVMTINYRMGDVGSRLNAPWTLEWDKYLFLNSSLQASFHERSTQANSKSMAPPTDLSEYFETQPNYNDNLRIVRHSSQGDVKYPKDFNGKVSQILNEIPDSEIFLMPAPSFFDVRSLVSTENSRIHCHQKNVPPVKEFLAQGNVFWYHLPEGYEDQGPKVILESMASGLCVVADNHSGAKDRITPETGWLCNNFEEHLQALKLLGAHPETREASGTLARERAKKEFLPERWIEEIIGA